MRILIGEDDIDLNKIITKKLKADGYIVDSCYNGQEVLDYMNIVNYDVVILDIMMPELDGLSTVKEIRNRGDLTPIIFLTAKDTINDKVKGLDIGANDYIVKPFSFEELKARIRAIIRTKSENPTNIYTIGDLSLNRETHEVKMREEEIIMTSTEYKLLEYLIINKNKVLSREKIEENIWDFDYEGGTNIVDVYIAYLRKKIDDKYNKKLIHTIRGVGYSLREKKS